MIKGIVSCLGTNRSNVIIVNGSLFTLGCDIFYWVWESENSSFDYGFTLLCDLDLMYHICLTLLLSFLFISFPFQEKESGEKRERTVKKVTLDYSPTIDLLLIAFTTRRQDKFCNINLLLFYELVVPIEKKPQSATTTQSKYLWLNQICLA